MKAFLLTLMTLVITHTAVANDILVMRKSTVLRGSTYNESNPGATPTGDAPVNFSSTETAYLVIDLTTSTFVEVSYFASGSPVVKSMVFGAWRPLSDLWDLKQPVKGSAGSFVISHQSGERSSEAEDSDGDLINDNFAESFRSQHYSGIATPLVVGKVKTIPAVPRLLSGKVVETTYLDSLAITLPEGTVPATRGLSKTAGTISITLDVVLTPAANTTAIIGTTDIAPGTTASKAAATIENGLQRVRNALYAKGYRVP
jgi:hypothetical protein